MATFVQVDYDDDTIHVNWNDYYTMGATDSKDSCFSRSHLGIVNNNGDHVIVVLKDKTKFKIALSQLDSQTFVISGVRHPADPPGYTAPADIDALHDYICGLIQK